MQKTSFLKISQIEKKWYLIDATDLVVGRLAVEISKIIRGKKNVALTPHLDCGDNVIVVNADKVHFSGNKWKKKIYYKHTGYIGHLKQRTPKQILDGHEPERILRLAVKRMMANTPLSRRRLSNLYLYCGSNHPHEGQNPINLNLVEINNKISSKRS